MRRERDIVSTLKKQLIDKIQKDISLLEEIIQSIESQNVGVIGADIWGGKTGKELADMFRARVKEQRELLKSLSS